MDMSSRDGAIGTIAFLLAFLYSAIHSRLLSPALSTAGTGFLIVMPAQYEDIPVDKVVHGRHTQPVAHAVLDVQSVGRWLVQAEDSPGFQGISGRLAQQVLPEAQTHVDRFPVVKIDLVRVARGDLPVERHHGPVRLARVDPISYQLAQQQLDSLYGGCLTGIQLVVQTGLKAELEPGFCRPRAHIVRTSSATGSNSP